MNSPSTFKNQLSTDILLWIQVLSLQNGAPFLSMIKMSNPTITPFQMVVAFIIFMI